MTGLVLLLATPALAQSECVGDCNGSRSVTIAEVTTAARIFLELAPLSACPAADSGGNGAVSIA